MSESYKINSEYFDELINAESSKIVGKIMKRYEIVAPENDQDLTPEARLILKILKKETKELINYLKNIVKKSF